MKLLAVCVCVRASIWERGGGGGEGEKEETVKETLKEKVKDQKFYAII